MALIDPHSLDWDDFVALLKAAPYLDTVVRLVGRETIRRQFDPIQIADAAFCADKAQERHRRRLVAMFRQYHGMSVAEIIEAFKAEGPPVIDEGDRHQLFLFTPLDS